MGPELNGSYPMHIRHVLRGGLLTLGIAIGAMSITAAADSGTRSTSPAPAVDRAAAVVPAEVASGPVRFAPAATPILIEVAAMAEPDGGAEPASWPEPDRPVVQAGPGPATPVEGATTLIDPLVIER